MDETLADILAQAAAQTPAESLRNVAQCVIGLTTITRYYNGRGRSRTYSGDIDAIADAARHLAELVLAATPTPAQTSTTTATCAAWQNSAPSCCSMRSARIVQRRRRG